MLPKPGRRKALVMSFVRRGINTAYTLWHTRGEEELPFLPLSKIQEIQNRRVRSMIRHAYDTVLHGFASAYTCQERKRRPVSVRRRVTSSWSRKASSALRACEGTGRGISCDTGW